MDQERLGVWSITGMIECTLSDLLHVLVVAMLGVILALLKSNRANGGGVGGGPGSAE